MRRVFVACVVGLTLGVLTPAFAQEASITILSPDDVANYRAIFAAQEGGDVAQADAAMAKLADPILKGYILRDRYLSKRYRVSFDELRDWMQDYAALDGSERIYRLAMRKRGRRGPGVAGPAGMRQLRGGAFDNDGVSADSTSVSTGALGTLRRVQSMVRENRTEAAHEMVRGLAGSYSQSDIDRLYAFVARAYFAERKDEQAYALADDIASREYAPHGHWTAGLAAYRLGRYQDSARHFEALLNRSDPGARRFAGAAFWAARARMRSGEPEKVVPLYARAASESGTFYGMIASRLLGREAGPPLTEPTVDSVTLARLVQNNSAHRAIAMWQIGRTEEAQSDLVRAYSEMPAEFDPAFAALARRIGPATLELRAAESAVRRGVYLTSLFPEPAFEPHGGYTLDKALILGIARQESRLQAIAVSSAGARGVMQIMPDTAARITGDSSLAGRGRTRLDNPGYNMQLGQQYIRDLLDRSNGSLIGLCAAYNGGLGNLSKWLARHEGNDDPLMFVESIGAPETREYVKRVLTNIWMYRKRFNEPTDGIDQAAAGKWPIYSSWPAGRTSAVH